MGKLCRYEPYAKQAYPTSKLGSFQIIVYYGTFLKPCFNLISFCLYLVFLIHLS